VAGPLAMTVMYAAEELGTFRTLCKCRGTMVPMVGKSPIFWLLLLVHAVLLVIVHLEEEEEVQGVIVKTKRFQLPPMNYSAVGTVTALLTFFLVFYGSQSYSRLNMFFGHCVGIGGNVMNWVCLVRNHFPADPNVQWNATRLLLASMHIQYYTLNESEGGAAITAEEWDTIKKRNLLKQSEIAALKNFTGYKPFLPLVWALGEVEDALLPKPDGDASEVEVERANMERFRVSDLLSNFRELAFTFRGHCGQISNWLKQPVPFPYFHVLTLLLVLDLLLISYGLVTLNFTWYLTAVIYTIICLIFLGLKEVAVAMSDPFGDDAIDFDLEAMLSGAYKNAVALLRDTRASDGHAIGDLINPITCDHARFTVDFTVEPMAEATTARMLAKEIADQGSSPQPTLVRAVSGKV